MKFCWKMISQLFDENGDLDLEEYEETFTDFNKAVDSFTNEVKYNEDLAICFVFTYIGNKLYSDKPVLSFRLLP